MRANSPTRSPALARCRSTRPHPTSSGTWPTPSFNLERAGHIYSRISNPTVAVLEERIAALDGGVGAIATASGHAALHLAIVTLMGQGSHIVASSALYGGSHNLFSHTLPRFGIETTKVHPRDLDGFRKAIRLETKLVFAETIGNPGLEVTDIPALAEIAHGRAPLMLDATFTTPYLMRPLDHGATSSTPRPSGSAGMVSRSAVCWSTVALSIGSRPASSRP